MTCQLRDCFVAIAPRNDRRGVSLLAMTLKQLVGARGFEPPTASSQSWCATRLRYAPTSSCQNQGSRLGQGTAPVAHAVLLHGRQLGQRLPKLRHVEDRVIPESAIAGRRLRDLAVQFALHHLLAPSWIDESHHAHEPRAAALRRHALQKPQQLEDIILVRAALPGKTGDRKSTRLNSSHGYISYAVFCLKKK